MTDRFRHDPPEPSPAWIARPRLLRRLERRFELAATVVAAPAGYGKTAAMAQAVAAGEDNPLRGDRWLQCLPADADAEVLGPALLQSLGLPTDTGVDVDPGAIADGFLRFAPAQVCLVLDDVHFITAGSSGARLLEGVLAALPRNGHLLLVGRTSPPIRMARQQVQGTVEHLGTHDLEFDDDELDKAAVDPDAPIDEAARWPAMSALTLGAGSSATIDFLLEEVAASLGPERQTALAALSHLSDVDDRLVSVASDGAVETAAELLADLPLVQRSPEGTFQLHDLWRQALGARRLDAADRAALVRLADVLLADGHPITAADVYVAAGSRAGAIRAATALASQPLLFVSAADVRRMNEVVGLMLDTDHPLAGILRAAAAHVGDERASAEAFEAAAATAAEHGERAVEVLALQNAVNMRTVLDPSDIPEFLLERADALAAAGEPMASTLSASIRSHQRRSVGDPEGAVAALAEMLPAAGPVEVVAHAFGMSDLGRPEEVLTPADLDEAAEASLEAGGQYLAQAVWLRGDVNPELALEVGAQMASATDDRRVPHLQVSTNGVLCLIALAAGDMSAAREFMAQTNRLSSATASLPVRAFAPLGRAAVALCEGDESAAKRELKEMTTLLPLGRWPPRPYLYSLAMVYALVPDARPVIDLCPFGPALTTARAAGAALVALAEHDDPGPAAALPWNRPWMLRAHVLPPHLAVLASAAAASGGGEVGAVLDELPAARSHLVAVTRSTHAATAAWATRRVATMPARPDYDVHVGLLGAMRLARGDTVVVDRAWVGRDRVRQLLAYLVAHRGASRRRVAEALWPDLATKQALSNLRVNLTHLQRVLQPQRDGADRPWFVRADNETLTVADSGLVVDVDLFDDTCRHARHLDDRAQGTRAIDAYRRGLELYRGDYLEEWPDGEWAEAERFRLRALATGARCRLGELLLARGEPEEAAAHASTALRAEPLHEGASRLLAHSFVAQGNRAAARRVVRDLLERIGQHGLAPERETVDLAASFGVTAS